MSRSPSALRLAAPLRHAHLSRGPLVLRCRLHRSPLLCSSADAAAAATAPPADAPSAAAASAPTSPDTTPLRPALSSPPLPPSARVDPQPLSDFLASQGPQATSTTFRGTVYEHEARAALRALGFDLARTGGRGDRGVDLLGHWHVPGRSEPLRAFVQCKNSARKLGPSAVRELGGALEGTPAEWRGGGDGDGAVAVLCAAQEATAGVRDAVRSARRPAAWARVADGKVVQLLWNERVAEMGLRGVEVGWVYGAEGKELRLLWGGRRWEPTVQGER